MGRYLLTAAAILAASPLAAQDCIERNEGHERLKAMHAQLAGQGLASGLPVQIWTMPNGNFLIIIDNGAALCIGATGTDWVAYPTGEPT